MDIKLVISIVAPILTTLLGFVLTKYFYNRPRLIAYYGHIAAPKINNPQNPEQPFRIHTHAVVIKNNGKIAAKNVRVPHYVDLSTISFTIRPKCSYEIKDISDGGSEIIFPILVHNEQVEITYSYPTNKLFHEINMLIKSDEGYAKILDVIPSPNLPAWQRIIFSILIFIGCSTIIYWLGILIVFFWSLNHFPL